MLNFWGTENSWGQDPTIPRIVANKYYWAQRCITVGKGSFPALCIHFLCLAWSWGIWLFFFTFLPPPLLEGELSWIYVEDVSCVEKWSVFIPYLSDLHGCVTYWMIRHLENEMYLQWDCIHHLWIDIE